MVGLGMLPEAPLAPIKAPKAEPGKSPKVVIIGAGLAGLCAAYEWQQRGIQARVLEARQRPGGRLWTVRGGDKETENGMPAQTCEFGPGHYFNVGPARIPHHHEITMHYCRELGLPLEVFANFNEGAFFYSQGKGPLANRRLRLREVRADLRGHTSELLAKAIHQDALDLPMSPADVEQLLAYLREEGGLDPDFLYRGNQHRGYEEAPGAGMALGKTAPPHQLRALLYSGLTHPAFSNVGEYTYPQQPTMFQIVGGNDQLATAMAARLEKPVEFGTQLVKLVNKEDSVELEVRVQGQIKRIEADYVVLTIPLPVLRRVDHNLSPGIRAAAEQVPYLDTSKVALEFNRRFWEEDDGVFGGISKTNMDITQIFYPSYGYLGKSGVLVGCYNFHQRAKKVGDLPPAERVELALDQGSRIHPQYRQELKSAFTVAWQRVPFTEGGWATYTEEQRTAHYPALLEPDGRVYLAGEHASGLNAWMAGALVSARTVVEHLLNRIG